MIRVLSLTMIAFSYIGLVIRIRRHGVVNGRTLIHFIGKRTSSHGEAPPPGWGPAWRAPSAVWAGAGEPRPNAHMPIKREGGPAPHPAGAPPPRHVSGGREPPSSGRSRRGHTYSLSLPLSIVPAGIASQVQTYRHNYTCESSPVRKYLQALAWLVSLIPRRA
jgi:hypothetical protein